MRTASFNYRLILACLFILACLCVLIPGAMFAQATDSPGKGKPASLPVAPPKLSPDARYKTDILLVIAHPDDDLAVDAYLAKAIDEGKRVSAIFMTRGRAGQNFVGNEQGLALADERELEARRAMAFLGITDVWFLNGPDHPGPDVLHSLELWGDGPALSRVVRLVRLTRPEVVITMLPDYVVGENHTNHQAAGVIATEAFDLAGDPLAFPEQVEAPRNHLDFEQYGEGLRPWQAKKIYYFSDSLYTDFYKGIGPKYSTQGVSVARGKSYAQIAYDAAGYYETQGVQVGMMPYYKKPIYLILGKSLVGGTPTGDIFQDITAAPIAYVRARGYEPPVRPALSVELGGPWAFYNLFWPAHNIERLSRLFSPQAICLSGQPPLWVPILIHNNTDTAERVSLRSTLPAGWTEAPGPMIYPVGAHGSYPVTLYVSCPKTQKVTWKTLTWRAETKGGNSASVKLRVNWMKLEDFLTAMNSQ